MDGRGARVIGVVSVVCAIVAGAGCGDDGDGDRLSQPHVSGTRLRANLLDGGGGAVTFVDWHDSQLGVDCTFSLAADGVLRCLPGGGWAAYGDASCSTPIALDFGDGDGCPVDRYARLPRSGDACLPLGVEVYPIGEPIESGPIYYKTATGCVDLGFGGARRALGPAIPSTEFVGEASRVTEVRGVELSATAITATDGTRQIIELVDPTRGGCEPRRMPSGVDACIAGIAYDDQFNVVYGDDACTTPIPAATYGACEIAPAAVVTATAVHLAGARIDGPVFRDNGSSCVVAEGHTGYQIGRVATDDDFPLLSSVILGSGPVQSWSYADEHGRALRPGGLFDSATGQGCTLAPITGEPTRRRCLPPIAVYVGSSVEFADAACTVPVRSLDSALASDALVAVSDATCQRWTVTAITTAVEHTGAVFHSLAPDTCTEATREPTRFYYAAGSAVPIDSFPLVTARTE